MRKHLKSSAENILNTIQAKEQYKCQWFKVSRTMQRAKIFSDAPGLENAIFALVRLPSRVRKRGVE